MLHTNDNAPLGLIDKPSAVAPHVIEEDVAAYVSGLLSPVDSDQLERHVEICSGCAILVDQALSVAEAWQGEIGNLRVKALAASIRSPNLNLSSKHQTHEAESENSISDDDSLEAALYDGGAIEYGGDYVLPSGMHCDTHVNAGAICQSEALLRRVTLAIAETLISQRFTVVVSAGWAMGTIARRLLRLIQIRGTQIRHVRLDGYRLLDPLAAVPDNASVLVLLDVVATGGMLAGVTAELASRASLTVRAIAIAEPTRVALPPGFQALCRIPMVLSSADSCEWCASLPRLEYNPVACRLTRKKEAPLSISQFIEENCEANEFWELVNIAGAFEHHHVEGRRHYSAYVDTLRLLRCLPTGPIVVERMCERIRERDLGIPTVILVRNRQAAVELGRAVSRRLAVDYGVGLPELVVARKQGGSFKLSAAGRNSLNGASVLVMDTAAAHGDTIDQLSLLCDELSTKRVGALVLLSRLGEACEEALNARLSGGFQRLYSVPIPPFEVYQSAKSCKVCSEVGELRAAVESAGLDELRPLLTRASRRSRSNGVRHELQHVLSGIGQERKPLLQRCRRGVAAGIALHALHSSMGNGMAPIALSELYDSRIPTRNRIAILEGLPSSSLRAWSGDRIISGLTNDLSTSKETPVWSAVVSFLSRAGSVDWVDIMPPWLAENGSQLSSDRRFWCTMVISAFRAGRGDPQNRYRIERGVREALGVRGEDATARGLRRMLVAVDVAGPHSNDDGCILRSDPE